MKKSIIWVIISIILILSMVLTGCSKKTTTTTTPTTNTPTTTAVTDKPQYGGTFNMVYAADSDGIDPDKVLHTFWGWFDVNVIETMFNGDWAKGPAGTNQVQWLEFGVEPPEIQAGVVCESWARPSPDVLIFKVRKGIHFQQTGTEAGNLVNGRELTAEDLAYSIKRLWSDIGHYWNIAYPYADYFESVEVTGPYEVTIKTKPGKDGPLFTEMVEEVRTIPKEVIDKYGDMTDWHNMVGSGPFMVKDYTPGSVVNYVKNPNYWATNPCGLGKGDKLPYLDGYNAYIITDPSTRTASLRTGKLDWVGGFRQQVSWEDANTLKVTNPELKYNSYMQTYINAIMWRTDNKPFDNLDVRRALSMAIDRDSLVKDLYGGNAIKYCYPVSPSSSFVEEYTPFDQLPQSVQELYTYNPEKAKQLLAAAGYANGFETSVLCMAGNEDLLSALVAQWAKVNVKVTLDVREEAAFAAATNDWAYPAMVLGEIGCAEPPYNALIDVAPNQPSNQSKVSDPKITAAWEGLLKTAWDYAEGVKQLKAITPYLLDQAYILQMPSVLQYTFWQPYIKNYHGEMMIGDLQCYNFPKYIWVDQKLKSSMGK